MKLGPRSVERPGDRGVTSIHVFGNEPVASVDGGGLIQASGASWSIDWWIGGDDRWYYPARESTVRQRRVGAGPVIETSVRIPSGDAIQTVYAVNVGGRDMTVVEVRNDSPVPVALALAVRPYSAQPDGKATAVSFVIDRSDEGSDSAQLSVSSAGAAGQHRHIISLPRKPNQIGSSATADLWDEIEAGADLQWTDRVGGSEANAVCLYPLPHKTSLRFVIAEALTASGSLIAEVAPSDVPDPDAVARGWSSIVEATSRFELPDSGLTELAKAARARTLGAGPTLGNELASRNVGGSVLKALALGGYQKECESLLLQLASAFPSSVNEPNDAASELDGVAHAAALVNNSELTNRSLESMAQLLHLIERTKDKPATAAGRRGLAKLAIVAGQLGPAQNLWEQTTSSPPGHSSGDQANLEAAEQLPLLAENASPSGRWTNEDGSDSLDAATQFWLLTRSSLLIEQVASAFSESPTVDLLPQFPSAWRGGPVEVHRAHTLFGWVSFAIRWHGYRPALLWEVEPASFLGEQPVTLRCPGLDPDWSTTESSGETLLAGTTEELPETPQPGDSFI